MQLKVEKARTPTQHPRESKPMKGAREPNLLAPQGKSVLQKEAATLARKAYLGLDAEPSVRMQLLYPKLGLEGHFTTTQWHTVA